MTNAKKDNNGVPTITTLSDVDGASIMLIYADPNTHAIIASDGSTGTGPARSDAVRDDNGEVAMIAVSSVDGITPVPLYGNIASGNKLLIKST